MPNLLSPFENEDWTLGGFATYISSPVHAGAKALNLLSQHGLFERDSSAESPNMVVVPGAAHVVSFWAQRTVNSQGAQFTFDVAHRKDGVALTNIATIQYATFLATDTWQLFSYLGIMPDTAIDRLHFQATHDEGPFLATQNWRIDTAAYSSATEESVVARGMYDSHAGLKAALLGINGSGGGYWHDLASSVFETMVTPDDEQGLPDVYLCVPFLDMSEVFLEQDEHSVRCISRFTIYGFTRDGKDSPTETDTVRLVSRLRDDIIKLLLNDHTLGATVVTAELGSGSYLAGLGSGEYGEIQMDVQITQIVDVNDLGPAA